MGSLALYVMISAASPCAMLSLSSSEVTVQHLDYQFALSKDERGLPTFSAESFRERERRKVSTVWKSIVLENVDLRVTLVPSMGRVHSLINKRTGHEQLWINPCAVPLGANNDTGFWVTWGGIEHVIPRREHGTTHALNWSHEVVVDAPDRKTVRCAVKDPMSGLVQAVFYTLYADRPFLETIVVVTNPSRTTKKYSHWTTAVLAPGASSDLAADTELIVPAENFVPDERDFNGWMLPLEMSTRTSPLRMVKNWKSIGDLLSTPLKRPYYAVYSHGDDEGFVHTFDLDENPTVDIWGWGYPASEERQREFTAGGPTTGYIEFWNGNASNFKDGSLREIGANETISWTQRSFCLNGLLAKEHDLREAIDRAVARHHPLPLETTAKNQLTKIAREPELSVIARGDERFGWFQCRAVSYPDPKTAQPVWLMTAQQKTNQGGHGYYDIYSFESRDQGATWSPPQPIPQLKRQRRANGFEVVPGDLWLSYHPGHRRVLATGKSFNFAEGKREDYTREEVIYAVYDPQTRKWSDARAVRLPEQDKSGAQIVAPNAGCNQPTFAPNGNLILPIRYQRSADYRNYVTIVAECQFDGRELRYLKHGSEIGYVVGRGLYEPSVARYGDHYYLTMRSDDDAFVAKSADGLNYSPAKRWRFDDGESLGSYNTQQHWIVRDDARYGNALYLVYTRIASDNAHVFRRRAPLFMAQVDTENLRVIRATERVVVPEAGWTLGNFGVFHASKSLTCVVTSEGIPTPKQRWSDNSIWLSKIHWMLD